MCYKLDGPGSNPGGGRDIPHSFRNAPKSTQPSVQWVPSLFLWGEAAGVRRLPPTPSSAQIKERVELYLYSPSWSLRPGIGRTLLLPSFTFYILHFTFYILHFMFYVLHFTF